MPETCRFPHLQSRSVVVPLSADQQQAIAEFNRWEADRKIQYQSATCLCGAPESDSTLLACTDRYGLAVNTLLCTRCGLLRTSPRMDGDSLKLFYESIYRRIYTPVELTTAALFDEQVAHGRLILAAAPYSGSWAGRRVIEVGCGAGGILLPFKEAGADVAGCDFGTQLIEFGRSRGLPLFVGTEDNLPPGGADLIILSHLVEHLSDPIRFLEGLRTRFLNPGGQVYVEVPGVLAIAETYGALQQFLQNAHLFHFTLPTLRSTLARAGFNMLKGTEQVAAFFQAGQGDTSIPDGHPTQVLRYLDWVESHHLRIRIEQSARRLFWKTVNIVRPLWRTQH